MLARHLHFCRYPRLPAEAEAEAEVEVQADKLDWIEQYGQFCGEHSSVSAVDDRR